MQKKFDALKMALINGRASRKNFILTVVALVEIIMIMVVSTFAWVETTSSMEIKGTGNIDTITYNIANIGSSESYANKSINLSNYFRSAGNVHLSPASSADGTNIYFPVADGSGDTSDAYRKGNVDDKNVNYISFAFDLHAATFDSDFYFAKTPVIKVEGEEVNTNDIRIAITALGKTTIYSNTEDKTEEVVSSDDGTKKVTCVEALSKHVNSDTAPDNTELFGVKSGATERIIISLWLQKTDQNADKLSDYAGKTVTVEDFELVVGSTKVSFVDATTDFNGTLTDLTEFNGWHWVDNGSPQLLIFDGAKSYLMTKDADFDTNHKWVGRVPQSVLSDSSKTLYFCRCQTGTTSITGPEDPVVINYWTANISDAMSESSVIYTAYGATHSGGKIGYGTWGEVINIQLDTEATDVLPKPTLSASATNITVTNTSNANVVCRMNYHDNVWSGFVPVSGSASFKFSFSSSNSNYEIPAANRDTDEIISKFVVTSATTGYWDPPATVEIHSNDDTFGTVSVTGGASGLQCVKVTQGAEVTLTATPNTGYKLVGVYSDSAYKNKLTSYKVKAPNKGERADYYALFEIITFDVNAYAYTDGSNVDTGGTVKVSTSDKHGDTGSSSSLTVDYGTEVKFTASPASGYKFVGWYDDATAGNEISTSLEYTESITSTDNHTKLYARFTVAPVESDYYLVGLGGNYNIQDKYRMSYIDSKKTAVAVTVNLDAGEHTFKVRYKTDSSDIYYTKNDSSSDYSVTLNNKVLFNYEGGLGNEAKINITTSGDYTFTFTQDKYMTVTKASGSESNNVTITFDATSSTWVSGDTVVLYLYDRSTSKAYKMQSSGTNKWTVSVPSNVLAISFYRCNGEQVDPVNNHWNQWLPPERTESQLTYKASGNTDNNNNNWE